MKRVVAVIFGILFLAVSGMSAYSATETSPDAKDLFEKKCSVCHSVDRPKSKKKTVNEWETTVMRMINSNGAKIAGEEAKVIIDYLAKNYGK